MERLGPVRYVSVGCVKLRHGSQGMERRVLFGSGLDWQSGNVLSVIGGFRFGSAWQLRNGGLGFVKACSGKVRCGSLGLMRKVWVVHGLAVSGSCGLFGNVLLCKGSAGKEET